MKKLNHNWITKNSANRLYQISIPILGLTGGIATGKSTVAGFFRDAGISVIDADRLVKYIYTKASSLEFVKHNFPNVVENNEIQFKRLRELAFLNSENQLVLENFIYAQLPEAFLFALADLNNPDFVIYDVPLLFEKNLDTKVDTSICVYVPRKIQHERLIKRDHISDELAQNILSKQLDIEDKKNKSNLIIENTGDLEALKKKFDLLLSKLI